MAVVNFESREIIAKAVYFGIKGSGKSSNFRALYQNLNPEIKAGMFTLEEYGDHSTFKFLPISLGYIKDFHLKFHLFTLPVVDFQESCASILLTGIDGIVFVFDAALSRLEENLLLHHKVESKLKSLGIQSTQIARILQFNRLDAEGAISSSILTTELGDLGYVLCTGPSNTSDGAVSTLKLLSQEVISNSLSDYLETAKK